MIYLKKKLQMMKQEEHQKDVNAFVEFMVEEILKRARVGMTTFGCTYPMYVRYLKSHNAQTGKERHVSFQELESGLRDRFPDSKIEVSQYSFENNYGEQETEKELVVNWS